MCTHVRERTKSANYSDLERRAMIKIKMTYDKESEVKDLLEIIKKKVEIKKMKEIPDEKRKRLCIWGEKKL